MGSENYRLGTFSSILVTHPPLPMMIIVVTLVFSSSPLPRDDVLEDKTDHHRNVFSGKMSSRKFLSTEEFFLPPCSLPLHNDDGDGVDKCGRMCPPPYQFILNLVPLGRTAAITKCCCLLPHIQALGTESIYLRLQFTVASRIFAQESDRNERRPL